VDDDGEPLEVARRLHLPLRLVVGVERVRRVPARVQRAAAAAVAQRRAVGAGARVPDVVRDPAAGRGVIIVPAAGADVVQHAPPPGQVLHAPRRDGHRRPPVAAAAQVQRELWPPVEGEDAPVALEVARRHALGVLVDEPEQVHLDARAGPERRASPRREALEEPRVEALRERRRRVPVAVRRPAHLADHHRQVAQPDPPQRRHQRVEVGVEHVRVDDSPVDDRLRGASAAVEEGEVQREVGVPVQAEERVDVDGERRAAAVEEADHVRHHARHVAAEPPRRRHRVARRRVVHVRVHGDRRLDRRPVPGLV